MPQWSSAVVRCGITDLRAISFQLNTLTHSSISNPNAIAKPLRWRREAEPGLDRTDLHEDKRPQFSTLRAVGYSVSWGKWVGNAGSQDEPGAEGDVWERERERERDAGVRGCAWQLGQNWHHLRAEISSGERCARVLKTAVKLLWFGLLISTVSSSVTQFMEALKVTLKLPLVPDCQFFALHLRILP